MHEFLNTTPNLLNCRVFHGSHMFSFLDGIFADFVLVSSKFFSENVASSIPNLFRCCLILFWSMGDQYTGCILCQSKDAKFVTSDFQFWARFWISSPCGAQLRNIHVFYFSLAGASSNTDCSRRNHRSYAISEAWYNSQLRSLCG